MNSATRFPSIAAMFVFAAIVSSLAINRASGQDEPTGRLEFADKVNDDALEMVTSVEVSEDGKFLYASAWQAAAVTVWQRDLETGGLTKIQTIEAPDILNGAAALRLSPDQRYAVASAFRSQSAVLFERDAETGKLKKLDVATNDVDGVSGLNWAIDVAFSPDSKFVYVIDSRGSAIAFGVSSGSVTVFRITDEQQLEFVEAGQDSSFADVRGIAPTPDGEQLVVVSSTAASMAVLGRHQQSGKTHTQQVIEDERGGVHALDGAMALVISPDGRFVYVSSGRFRGDNAISVYQFDEEGKLSLIQELVNDEGQLKGFVGGNEITVSPDGRNVYAVASGSSALGCFSRDLETGRLKVLETISNEQERLDAAAGVCLSPDGQFVYVAAEQSSAISIYRRK